ncbi:MAG: phosphomannomutase, partial [Candidatus Liptonbacteria bacterium]
MQINPKIFRAYDIRGVHGTDFDDVFASDIANKVAVFLNAKSIVVGCDARPSSAPLAEAVIKGLKSAGAEVILIGECSTPMFYHAVI